MALEGLCCYIFVIRKDEKMKRNIFKLIIVTQLMLVVSIPTFAGQWQKGQGPNMDKWCYLNDDGTWAADGWKMIDGTFYYFDAEGWMLANTTTPDGGKVGADGAWIQEKAEGVTQNATVAEQNNSSIYPVKAPENVHWTEEFQVSWVFGKHKNGQLQHRYAYCIYNENTGERLSRYTGNMSPNGTSVTLGLSNEIVNKMESGTAYYFEVYAVDDSNNYQLSPSVRSESKIYTRPDVVLPAPTNLRWDGTKIVYDLPGISQEMTYQTHYQILYSPQKDGNYKKLQEGTSKLNSGSDMQRYMKAPGYYKYRLFLNSKDIQKALPSEYSEYSEAYHYTK